jgi:hypothetical protein
LPSITATTDVDVQDWFTYDVTTHTDTVYLPSLEKSVDADMTSGWRVYDDSETEESLFLPMFTFTGVAHRYPMFLESSLPSLSFDIVSGWNTDWKQNQGGFSLPSGWSMSAEAIVGVTGELKDHDTLFPGELPSLTGGGTDDQAADAGAALEAVLPGGWSLTSDCDVGTICTLSRRLPRLTLTGAGSAGIVVTLSKNFPMVTLSGISTGSEPMTLSKALPSLLFSIQASEHTRFGDYVLKFNDW